MVKRSLAVLVVMAVVLSIALTSGCAKKPQPVTLQMITMKQAAYSDAHISEMVKKFNEANPNITVQVTFVPYESLHDKIVTDLASGQGQYDVVLVDEIWPAEFAASNMVQDITARITPEMKAGVNPALLDILRVGDKYYGIPWILDTKFLFYNKNMLAKAGYTAAPKTWDELVTMAKTLKAKKICDFPIVWSWAQAEAIMCDYAQLVYSYGGDIIAPDGTAKFNQGGALDALKFMIKTLKDGVTNPNSLTYLEEDVRQVFSEGKAAFCLNWTYVYALANDPASSKVAGQVAIAPTPAGKPGTAVGVSGSMGLSLAKSTKHPEEAWKLIVFLTSEANQKLYASDSLPIWKAALDAPDLNAPKELAATLRVQYQAVKGRPQFVIWYNAFSTKAQVALQQALLGKATPEAAMSQLVKDMDSVKK
ncbi:MAG TPA: extracellular solute-binding protein [Bacillota bacterium]